MLVYPAAYGHLVGVDLELPLPAGHQTSRALGQEHDHLTVEHFADVPDGNGEERIDSPGARKLSTHGVKGGRLLLPLACDLHLAPDTHGETADDEAHQQHDRERDEVLGVGNGERE